MSFGFRKVKYGTSKAIQNKPTNKQEMQLVFSTLQKHIYATRSGYDKCLIKMSTHKMYFCVA